MFCKHVGHINVLKCAFCAFGPYENIPVNGNHSSRKPDQFLIWKLMCVLSLITEPTGLVAYIFINVTGIDYPYLRTGV